MSEFATCCDECAPEEQVRGQMGPGDYFGVISDGTMTSAEPAGAPAIDHYLFVQIHEQNRNDIRIACRKCFLQTGWVQKDLPNMPEMGREFCIKQWKQLVEDKLQKKAMIATMREQFGEEAVKKFFKRSL